MRVLAAALLLFAAAPLAQANQELWQLLANGGQVLFIRHATTTPGAGDPDGFRIEDCKTQRNLSEAGRAEARRLGEVLRKHKVPVGEILSSPWCRCHDTARLAFGREATTWTPLSNLFGRGPNTDAQVRDLRARIGAYRGKDNLVMVSHGSVAVPLAGIGPQQAEVIVLTPQGGSEFRVAGRIPPP